MPKVLRKFKYQPLVEQEPSNMYGEYKERVEKGEVLDWKNVTKRELYYMNIIERKTHEQIGKLYGVSMGAVRTRMGKAGLSAMWKPEMDELVQDIERKIWNTLRYSNRTFKDYKTYYRILDAIHPDFNEVA